MRLPTLPAFLAALFAHSADCNDHPTAFDASWISRGRVPIGGRIPYPAVEEATSR